MADAPDEQALARDIIEVHGAEAATVARNNASAAALAGQLPQAKSWITVLGIIQRHQTHSATPHRDVGIPLPSPPTAETVRG
jgi:hypothetical protein